MNIRCFEELIRAEGADNLSQILSISDVRPARRRGLSLCVLIGAALLGGCASGDVRSSIFVDPSKYDLYDCNQLWTARGAVDKRVVELQALMAKADTGFAGPVVSGLAYQSDFAAAVAQRDLIDQKLASNNCPAQTPPAPPPAPPKGRARR